MDLRFSKKNFFYCINSLHPTINITLGYSITEINFLGVTVTKFGSKLEIDLYCKPTNTHQSLHAINNYLE